MTIVTAQISVSADGYAAGPNQRPDEPLGDGGERLHDWVVATETWRRQHGREGGEHNTSSKFVERMGQNVGAVILGRKMFGGGEGEWDENWRGWWGDEPPFPGPAFVLTHHERAPLTFANGASFEFVTDGIEAALARAKAAAGEKDVTIAGGASTINQFLAAGLLDELVLNIAPVVLGGGERLLVDVGTPEIEQIEAVAGDGVVHVRYRVG